MARLLKRVLLGVFITLVVLVLAAIGAAYALQDKIAARILTEVNKQVTVPVQVQGGVHLSLLRHFPYASLTFNGLRVDDKLQKGKTLLDVKEFSLLCNMISLLQNKIELSEVYLKDGSLNFYKDNRGRTNFDIFKPSQDTTKSDFYIRLKQTKISNVKLTFIDKSQSTLIDAQLDDATLKARFSTRRYDLVTNINGSINRLTTGGEELATNRKVKAKVVLDINNDTHCYTFKKGNIEVDGSAFSITGYIASVDKGTMVDFKLVNDGKDIQNLVGLIPAKYRASFSGADGSGEYSIIALVKGLIAGHERPKITVDANLKNSELKLSKYNKLLKKVNATVKYEVDEKGRDKIVISNFDCILNDAPFGFKLTIDNLADPDFDFYSQGVLNLAELSSLIPDSVVTGLDGSVTFKNFHIKGSKRDLEHVDSSTLYGTGDFALNQIEFQQNGISYGNINGALSYHGRSVEIKGLTVNFLGNQADFTGRVDNILAFIYNLSANRSANNVVLGVNGILKAKTLNLSGIIAAYAKKKNPVAATRGKIDVREIVNMQGDLDVRIGRFVYQNLELNNVQGFLQISPGMVQCNNLDFDAMKGNVKANGRITFGDDYSIHFNYDIRAVNLDVPEIFMQCSNFGQTVLTDKNLKGTLSSNISINAVLNDYKQLDMNSLTALIDFDVTNGELVKFEPLKAASRFIKVKELEDIKFSELKNTLNIEKGHMVIPQFEIKSTALNLMMEGTHYFDNTIDYHFTINLHKFLAQRFNRKLADLRYMEDDPYQGLNLYLGMSGNLNNPEIKFDKLAAKKKVKNDFKKEKENLKALVYGNSPAANQPPRSKSEEKYFDVNTQPQFIDFDSTGQ
ncbi:MAG TPA: AsmA-like C-terminal region-containing protein [Chitinophagales bacterium]|nr:AsmA-like C-terminal region-containing protein [Chitinophagales bacterium]